MPSPARKLQPLVSARFARPVVLGLMLSLVIGLVLALAAPVSAEPQAKRRTPAVARQSNDAHNREVRIHNQTGWSMTYLYASSGGDWSGDLLGSGTLSPGRSVVVRIDDGSGACRYSLRAEFDNGQSLQRNGVNACQVADYYFTR